MLELLPDCYKDYYDKETLLILGCLWCSGTAEEKAKQFLRIVNPPTKTDSSYVAADDRDFPRIFYKVFKISTWIAMEQS